MSNSRESHLLSKKKNKTTIRLSGIINKFAKLSISGHVHKTLWKTLLKIKNTRLEKLARQILSCDVNINNISKEGVLKIVRGLVDDIDLTVIPGASPDEKEKVFYFNRDPIIFLCIIDYYRTGKLHVPDIVCTFDFFNELDYWGINPAEIESCCHHKIDKAEENFEDLWEKTDLSVLREQFKDRSLGEIRFKIWKLFEVPESSYWAKFIAFISILLIFISTTCLVLNTIEAIRLWADTSDALDQGVTVKDIENPYIKKIEDACIIGFTIEYLIRLIVCPNKWAFLKNTMNMVDLIAILPFPYKQSIFRIVRVTRILKLGRHSTGLQSLGYTLKKSQNELSTLFLSQMLTIMIFGSLMFYIEKNAEETKFTHIKYGFWWAVATITTVGYGDVYPITIPGKVLGIICSVIGVLIIACPIPIIVTNFTEFYESKTNMVKNKKETSKKRKLLSNTATVIESIRDDNSEPVRRKIPKDNVFE